MSVQERIRLLRMMEMMEERNMKEDDGVYRYRNEEGETLVAIKMETKEQS